MTNDELVALDARIHTEVLGIIVSCERGDGCHDIPPYSSSLDAAWTILDELIRLGFDFCLSPAHIRAEGYELEIITTGALYDDHGYVGVYDTDTNLPLMICRAALYCLGLDKTDAD